MATKTFKLGEICRGGVITVNTKGNVATIIGKEWDFSTGTRKSSNQSNAKEFTRLEVDFNDINVGEACKKASRFLRHLTTDYHTGLVMEWIGTKVKTKSIMFW